MTQKEVLKFKFHLVEAIDAIRISPARKVHALNTKSQVVSIEAREEVLMPKKGGKEVSYQDDLTTH